MFIAAIQRQFFLEASSAALNTQLIFWAAASHLSGFATGPNQTKCKGPAVIDHDVFKNSMAVF
jgi:hypothetical protein